MIYNTHKHFNYKELYFKRFFVHFHSHIFWIGDLNYRIEEPPGLQLPCNRASPNAYDVLMKYDQLRIEMGKGNCFDGYSEGRIKFRPTYKYDVGTDNFDSRCNI